MFKWQLPLQKGTDVFPHVTVMPMIVRKSIVLRQPLTGEEEGTVLDAANKIFAENYAGLMHFIAAQRQGYALGLPQYQQKRVQFQGGEATMAILQGQEIVDITLYPELPIEENLEGTIALLLNFNNFYVDSNPRIRLRMGSRYFPSEGYYSMMPLNDPPEGATNGGIITDLVAENDMLCYGGDIAEGYAQSDYDDATGGYRVGTMALNLARIIRKPKSDVTLVVEMYKDEESKRRISTGEPTGGYEYVEYKYLGASWYEGTSLFTGNPAWGPYGDVGFTGTSTAKVNEPSGIIRVDFPSGRPTGGSGYYTLTEVSAYGVSYSYENLPPIGKETIGTTSTPENYVDRQWIVWWVQGLTEEVTTLEDRGNWGVSFILLPDYSDLKLSWFGHYAASFTYEHGTYWWDRGVEPHTASTWTLDQEAMFTGNIEMKVTESGLVHEQEMLIPKDYWRKNLRGLKG